MFARTGLAALTSAGLMGLGMAAFAAPAHANTTVTVSGELTYVKALGELTGATVAPEAVTGATVTIAITATWADGSTGVNVSVEAPGVLSKSDGTACESWACVVVAGGTPVTFEVHPSAAGTEVTFEEVEGYPIDGRFFVTYTPLSDDPSGSASGPAPLMQQFPRPATGTCDAAQPEGLDWFGVASGGWGESWSWWMHEGAGGEVCTRTLVYNASTAAWEVD